jgi:hypothetical protein
MCRQPNTSNVAGDKDILKSKANLSTRFREATLKGKLKQDEATGPTVKHM